MKNYPLLTSLAIAFLVIALLFIGSTTAYLARMEDIARKSYQLQERDNMEYQIMLEPDSIVVWQNTRYVGSVPNGQAGKIDSLLIIDNQ